MMNKKQLPHVITIGAFFLFVVLGLACGSTPSSYSSGSSSSRSSDDSYSSSDSYSGGDSSSSEKSYTVVNRSSYTVNLHSDAGTINIASGGTSFIRMDVNRVSYTPDDKVAVGVSGDTVIFTDR